MDREEIPLVVGSSPFIDTLPLNADGTPYSCSTLNDIALLSELLKLINVHINLMYYTL